VITIGSRLLGVGKKEASFFRGSSAVAPDERWYKSSQAQNMTWKN